MTIMLGVFGLGIYLLIGICLDIFALIGKNQSKGKILVKKILLWIYQMISGVLVLFIYEKVDSFISQLLILLSLVINTLVLVVFNIKLLKNGKTWLEKISFISILAILCGGAFICNYTYVLLNNSRLGYDDGLREIMYLETYSKAEAEEFLENMYYALRESDDYTDNVELYGIWVDDEKPNEYYANFRVLSGGYLPANATKVVVSAQDKTKVERIYWQFNDEVEIDFYNGGRQVDEYLYVYNCAIMGETPIYPIKDYFEDEVKEQMKSPSSAIFTYKYLKYSPVDKRFKIYGWVEGQNSFGAMVKTDFIITFKPCSDNYCEWYGLDYTWTFN